MSPDVAQGEMSNMVFGYLPPEQHQTQKQVEQSVMLLVQCTIQVLCGLCNTLAPHFYDRLGC